MPQERSDETRCTASPDRIALAVLAPLAAGDRSGQQAAGRRSTPAAQAAAGRSVYQANCASCHMPDLAGRNEAPPLAGDNFMNTWRTRTTRDLFEFMSSTMPPTGETLSAGSVPRVTAYILQSNGAAAGRAAARADDGGAHRHDRDRPPRRCSRRRAAAADRDAPTSRRGWRARPRRARAGAGGGRGGRGGAPANAGRAALTVAGRGEELRAGHRRDAAQSAIRATG